MIKNDNIQAALTDFCKKYNGEAVVLLSKDGISIYKTDEFHNNLNEALLEGKELDYLQKVMTTILIVCTYLSDDRENIDAEGYWNDILQVVFGITKEDIIEYYKDSIIEEIHNSSESKVIH